MTDVVAFLVAELARVEKAARAIPRGPWQWMHRDVPVGKYTSLEGPDGHSVLRTWSPPGTSSWLDVHPAFDTILPEPEAVLLRAAKVRQILDEHELLRREYPVREGTCFCCSRPFPTELFELTWCSTCHDEDDVQFEAYWHGFQGGPCRTVRLLAEAWGWAEDAT